MMVLTVPRGYPQPHFEVHWGWGLIFLTAVSERSVINRLLTLSVPCTGMSSKVLQRVTLHIVIQEHSQHGWRRLLQEGVSLGIHSHFGSSNVCWAWHCARSLKSRVTTAHVEQLWCAIHYREKWSYCDYLRGHMGTSIFSWDVTITSTNI